MSLQIFVLELFVDFLIYFLFWFMVVFCINKFLTKIRAYKIVTIGLWSISALIIIRASYIASFSENVFHFRRTYDMEIMETGYCFFWQRIELLDYYKRHPEERPVKKRLGKETVSHLNKVLTHISERSISLKYDAKELNDNGIYPEVWHNDNSPNQAYNERHILEDFKKLKMLVDEADSEGDYIFVFR